MPGRSTKCRLLAALAVAPLALEAAAAPSPLIDTKTSAPVTNVSREDLEKLPIGRRIEDLIRTCPSNTIPTVSRQSNVLIDGKPLVDLNCIQPADLDMIEVYKAHNIARAEYGAPPLVWDPALVQSSGAVAGQRVRTGTPGHSSREGRGTVRENISQGLPWWSTRQLLENWTKERKSFVPGIFPNVSRTHNWYDIGHWAQMIWIQTVLIGCTKAVGGASAWLVCHYNPGGNKDGKPVGIPVQPQQVASAPGRSIQPRLIGGDYGGKIAQGQTPKTELPWHPQFNPRGKRSEVDQELVLDPTEQSTGGRMDYDEFIKPGVATSLFDLGIYGGIEPWDNSGLAYRSFDRDPDHEYIGLADALSSNYEYGYDMPLGLGYDRGELSIGVYADFQARVDYLMLGDDLFLDLPSSDVGQPSAQPIVNAPSYGTAEQRASLFDLGIYGGGAYSTDWFQFDFPGADDGTLRELERGMGRYEDHDVGRPFDGGIYWDPVNQVTVGAGASYVEIPQAEPEVATKVEQPDLAGKAELYNPNIPNSVTDEVSTKVEQPALPKSAIDTSNSRSLGGLTYDEVYEDFKTAYRGFSYAKNSSMFGNMVYYAERSETLAAQLRKIDPDKADRDVARDISRIHYQRANFAFHDAMQRFAKANLGDDAEAMRSSAKDMETALNDLKAAMEEAIGTGYISEGKNADEIRAYVAGLKVKMEQTVNPNYQETKVSAPALPATAPPPPPIIIDPDYSAPIQIDLSEEALKKSEPASDPPNNLH